MSRDLDEAGEYFVATGLVPSELLDNEIELMRYLKFWTASWIPRITGPVLNKSRIWSNGAGAQGFEELLPDDQLWSKSTLQLYEIFSTFQYGALCGHVAWTLMSVYESFGFKAFTYNYGKPPDSVFTHVTTLVKLSDSNIYLQDGDFGREYFLGSTDDVILDSLQQIITKGIKGVRDHEKLIRNFISMESLFSIQKNFAETYPPLDVISLSRPPERLNGGRLLWEKVSVTPESLNQGFGFDSALKFLSLEGKSCTLDAMLGYPIGIANRDVGWVTPQNPEETENGVLLQYFISLYANIN